MGFGTDSYAAIELAIRATGQADVDALTEAYRRFQGAAKDLDAQFQASAGGTTRAATAMKGAADAGYEVGGAYEVVGRQVGKATEALEKEAAAAAWMQGQAKNLNQLLADMAEHEATAEKATLKLADAQEKAGKGVTAASAAGGMGAYKWLLLGNAIQDVQYGFGAIVNNIPGLVMGFGGSAGLAGAVGIAAVGLQQLIAHVGDIRTLFGQELPEPLVMSVKALQDKLKGLEAKEYKTRIDYSDIELAKKKLADLTEAEAAYERLKSGKSKVAQEAGRQVGEAIVEHGGGDDFESSAARVARAAAAVGKPEESGKTKDLRARLAAAEKMLSESADPDATAGLTAAVGRHSADLDASMGADKGDHEKKVRDRIGRAGQGYEGDRAWLEGLIRSNPGAFAAQGAQPGLLSGIAEGSRQRVEAKGQAKIEYDLAGEKYEADTKTLKEGKDKLHKEIDLANEAEAESIEAGQQQGREATAGHKKAVSDAVSKVGPGFTPEWEASVYEHSKAGSNIDDLAKRGRPNLMAAIKGRGVAPEIVGDVADAIIAKAKESALNLVASGGTPQVTRKEQQAGKRDDAAYKKAVDAVDDPYLPGIKAAFARNQLAHVQGDPAAIPHAQVARQLQGEVARTLRASGQDPGLSRGVVESGFKQTQQAFGAGMAKTGNQAESLVMIVQQSMGVMAREMAQAAQRDQRINMLAVQLQMLGQQGRASAQQRGGLMPNPGAQQ